MFDFEDRLKSLENIEETVADCLKEDERCRNNDWWLIKSVLKKQGVRMRVQFEDCEVLTSAETITRARRKIQNDCLPLCCWIFNILAISFI